MSLVTFEINTAIDYQENESDVECGLIIWKANNTFVLLCKFCKNCFMKLEEFVIHTTNKHKSSRTLTTNSKSIQKIKDEYSDSSYMDDCFDTFVVKEEENVPMNSDEYEMQSHYENIHSEMVDIENNEDQTIESETQEHESGLPSTSADALENKSSESINIMRTISSKANFNQISSSIKQNRKNDSIVNAPAQKFVVIQQPVVDEILRKLQNIEGSNIKILTRLDNVEKSLRPFQHDNFESEVESDAVKNYKFPLKTTEEVHDLNLKLGTNEDLRKGIIRKYSLLFAGNRNGAKVGYAVVDSMFSKELLRQYTWTGISKEKTNIIKLAFKSNIFIIDCIYKIIKNVDNAWSIKDNENLFKEGVLKHAKKRHIRESEKTEKIKERMHISNDVLHIEPQSSTTEQQQEISNTIQQFYVSEIQD